MDGVVRAPSAFSITFGFDPSITATQLLVVPRSIPMTLAIYSSLSIANPSRSPSGEAAPWPGGRGSLENICPATGPRAVYRGVPQPLQAPHTTFGQPKKAQRQPVR